VAKQTKKARYTDADIDKILHINQQLSEQVDGLQSQLTWLKRQIFGNKSEKLRYVDNPDQAQLDMGDHPVEEPVAEVEAIKPYKRRKKKPRSGTPDDSGIRFDEQEVDIKIIELPCPELEGTKANEYEVIGSQVDYRLAQRQSPYVMLKYVRKVVKHRPTQQVKTAPAPAGIFSRNQFDVSFIVGLLIDKFLYHQPLYRQHQKLERSGITLCRATLTNLSHRSISLLVPIVDAQLGNVLRSHVLAMDETSIKAGNRKKGKLHQGYYLPVYGDQDEMVFNYSPSKSRAQIEAVLSGFKGTLLSDGNTAYEHYVRKTADAIHAGCWSHSRRHFERACEAEPVESRHALDLIASLYHEDGQIQAHWGDDKKLVYRANHCQEVVNEFFLWCAEQRQRVDLLPSNPLAGALRYVEERQQSLREFLTDPAIPLDTNHLERGLRVIPMGRRAWLFCWTEVGAKYVGIIQSLIVTCRLQGINPSIYLTDVLQRVSTWPADRMIELTPRLWKETFAENPLISDLERIGQDGLI
jgi:transposase|tara:strand:+ start:819 stop:2390 length:1572 start_codon:yes stop_codon:yes gene_type:complete